MEEILFSVEKQIGLITLNRAQALNALSFSMIRALQEQLQAWESDPTIAAVVIRSAGGKAFCAGGDVRWLYDTGLAQDPAQMDFFWHEYRLNGYIKRYKKPYIAFMDGITMGGGVGISLHGSHPVATENFLFAMPETSIGFFPDIGASYLLAELPNYFGTYLALSGDRLNWQQAQEVALIRYTAFANDLEAILERLTQADLKKNAFAKVTDLLSEYVPPSSFSSSSSPSAMDISSTKDIIANAFCKERMEEIMLALQEDNPVSQKILATLSQKAPLSLKVTLHQMQKAKNMDLPACLQMDYCLVQHFMAGENFYEGVRALLVDKDKNPKWHPDSLEKCSQALVSSYFEPKESIILDFVKNA